MIKVVKGNVVLRVDDSLMDFYVNKGYTAKTLDGEIIKEAIPTDSASLRKAYIASKSEIKTLKERISVLEEEIASLKAQPKKTTQPVVQEGEPIVSEDKPKRTRKKLSVEE